ncbi:Ctr copper transporter [Spinellus fusiger]|nr:Ctr copper transporter [Spinellus fusiger]
MEGHGEHHGHDDMSSKCVMNMFFNWQIENLCIVFESWHISTPSGLILSCLAVFAIAAGYEYIRSWSALMESAWNTTQWKKKTGGGNALENDLDMSEADSMRGDVINHSFNSLSKRQSLIRSGVYTVLVAISFWLMLVFMTYNGYLMLSVVLGAGFGHYHFGKGNYDTKRSMQCH